MRKRIIRKAEKIICMRPESKAMEFYVSKEHNVPVKRKTINDLFINLPR